MKIKFLQTISNVFSENMDLESTSSTEYYVLQAEEGKLLKNSKTGKTTRYAVCVDKKRKIADYIEIDDPNAPFEEHLETL